jgi:hypothetical protein
MQYVISCGTHGGEHATIFLRPTRLTPPHQVEYTQVPFYQQVAECVLHHSMQASLLDNENLNHETPLHLAIQHQSLAGVLMLWRAGASLAKVTHGETYLHASIRAASLDIVEFFLVKGMQSQRVV